MDKYRIEYCEENGIKVKEFNKYNVNNYTDFVNKHLAAINYTHSCKSDSELLCEHPMSERADIFGSYRTYCLKCSTTL